MTLVIFGVAAIRHRLLHRYRTVHGIDGAANSKARRPRVVFACGARQYECHPLMWALPMPLLNCDVAYWYLGLADRL